MNKKFFIATLGGSVGPILYDINQDNYTNLILVTSNEEKNKCNEIKNNSEIKQRGVEICCKIINDYEMPDETYNIVKKLIGDLYKQGINSKDICVNITGGTKTMAAGAFYAAVSSGIRNVIYVGGTKRDQQTGRTITGHENIKKSQVTSLFIDNKIKEIKILFDNYEYNAALNYIDNMEKETRINIKDEPEILFLKKLTEAYNFWDKMDHEKALEKFKEIKITDDIKNTLPHTFEKYLSNNKKGINLIIKNKFFKIIDKYAAALRYYEKGYYILCVEFLYSIAEFIADYILEKKYHLNKNDVDLNLVKNIKPDIDEKFFNSCISKKSQKIHLSLTNSYELLSIFGDEIGIDFIKDEEYQRTLVIRNEMIHGNKTIDKHSTDNLLNITKQKINKFCNNYSEIKEKTIDELYKYCKFLKILES